MPLVNCKVELKHKWTNFCVLSAGGNDNLNDNDVDNKVIILFLLSKRHNYVPVVALSAKNNEKLSNLFSTEFKKSVSWNEYKTRLMNLDIFLNEISLE